MAHVKHETAEEQVITWSLIAMFLFAALGGAWFPLEVAGRTFATIGHLTPTAWAMDGLQNIVIRGQGLASVLLPAGMLLAYAITLAIMAREKTGRGQVVDSCLLNTGVLGPSKHAVMYLNDGTHRPINDPDPKPPNPMYALYETADGRWVMAIGIFTPDPFPNVTAERL